ncbi:MAG TPA: hypothetical protein VML55_05370, partial [Planctomycetaceae bacterium]|nr:hypothetical protein [Planctomycetaceae bacterium]
AKMTYRMMNVMMVVMGFLFYGVPAGLCVYFIASSLWGIGERKLLDRLKPAAKPADPSPAPAGAAPRPATAAPTNGDAKKGLWARLMDMAEVAQSQRNAPKGAETKGANGAKQASGGPRAKKRGKSKRR